MAQENIVVLDDTVDLKKKDELLTKDVKDIVLKVFEKCAVENIAMLSGGITNRLYKVDMIHENEDKSSVLVRINGRGTEHIIDRDHERNVLLQAQKFGAGPNMFCVFENGMIYQYFDGRSLNPDEMRVYATNIASQLARFHEMDIAIDGSKTESALLKQLLQWIDSVKKFEFKDDGDKARFAKFDIDALERDVLSLADTVKDYEIGFCHNDLLSGNILIDSSNDRFYFIDFEYCCYNYVAFDIANHFCEYTGFTTNRTDYPNDSEQETFIRAYLKERTEKEVTDESVQTLKEQIRVCAMLSNLYWGIWAIIQAKYSLIDFDYWAFAEDRLDWFLEMKSK